MRRFTYGTTSCQSCGHDVALNALICPHCGNYLPGKWDLDSLKSAGGLIVVVGLAIIGVFPMLPVLLGALVGIAPCVILYAILNFKGFTLGQFVDWSGNNAAHQSTAPYKCLKCNGGMWAINGVCPSCNFGANEMVCSCGLEVRQPVPDAFETAGVICPGCGIIMRR